MRPVCPEGQHLLWAIADDICALMKDDPGACRHRDRIPRRADAKTVQLSLAQGLGHERGRHDDKPDVFIWINVASLQPEAQLVMMAGKGKNMAKCDWRIGPFAAPCHDTGERPSGDARIGHVALRFL